MKIPIKTKVSPWGNSYGLRLPKNFIKEHEDYFKNILEVSMDTSGKKLIILSQKGEVKTAEYFRKQLQKMKPVRIREFDWGKPMGKEIW